LAIHPQSAPAYNKLAVALMRLGRSDEAVAAFEQSIKLDPGSAAAQYNLGLAFSKQHPTEAMGHLQKTIEIDSNLASAHRALGELHLQQHDFAAAETCLTLLKAEAERAEILSLIRRCHSEQSAN
jgi:tetratricopeptide (TPR) repeat protein